MPQLGRALFTTQYYLINVGLLRAVCFAISTSLRRPA